MVAFFSCYFTSHVIVIIIPLQFAFVYGVVQYLRYVDYNQIERFSESILDSIVLHFIEGTEEDKKKKKMKKKEEQPQLRSI